MVLTQTIKNFEGMTGTRTNLLRGQGRSFQVFEAPLGRPFGIAVTGLALPEITGIVQFSGEIFRIVFSTTLFGMLHVIPPLLPLWHTLEQ